MEYHYQPAFDSRIFGADFEDFLKMVQTNAVDYRKFQRQTDSAALERPSSLCMKCLCFISIVSAGS